MAEDMAIQGDDQVHGEGCVYDRAKGGIISRFETIYKSINQLDVFEIHTYTNEYLFSN